MRLLKHLLVVVMVLFLVFAATVSAAEFFIEACQLGTTIAQEEESDLHFSGYGDETEAMIKDEDYDTSAAFVDAFGYWFHDAPWFGLAPKGSVIQGDARSLEGAMEIDTGVPAFVGFLMFRYTKWQLQPHVGISPTLFTSDLEVKEAELLDNFVMGVSYCF